jgi:beta-glucanase (GH16 family)
MNDLDAHTGGLQRNRRGRRGVRWAVFSAVIGLATVASLSVACTRPSESRTPSREATVTVIATASPDPTSTPSSFEPLSLPSRPGYRLVFSDEFVGQQLNTKQWATSLPWGNTNRQEQQFYTPDSLSQRDGVLTITARKKATNGKPYASGVISSSDRFVFTYGYSEIRAQVPAGTGLWSAFWLVSPIQGSNDEADVMEVLGSDPSKGYAVLHYGTMAKKGRSLSSYRNPDFSVGFHTFAVNWEPDLMVWYVDGVERYRVTQNVPTTPMYLITNLAVGGVDSWSGPPNRYTQFPAELKVDYIRVFQRN